MQFLTFITATTGLLLALAFGYFTMIKVEITQTPVTKEISINKVIK